MATAPWLGVVLLLIITVAVNNALQLHSLQLTGHLLHAGDLAADGSSSRLPLISQHLLMRVGWGVAAIGFSLTALGVAVFSVVALARSLMDLESLERRAALLRLLLAMLLLLAIALTEGHRLLTEPSAMREVRQQTFYDLQFNGPTDLSTDFDQVSYVLFILLTGASCALLLQPAAGRRTPDVLARRLRLLHLILYAGATALLLVIYLPTALILRARADRLATSAVPTPGEAREKWLAQTGLATSPFQGIAHLALTVAPLLAGGAVGKAVALFT